MAWIVLVLSGLFEAVWAVALDRSDGFSRPLPSLIFVVGAAISMGGLAWALKTLPVGTAYAVWVGIGAVSTVVYAMVTGEETVSIVRILLLAVIIACVIGLRLIR